MHGAPKVEKISAAAQLNLRNFFLLHSSFALATCHMNFIIISYMHVDFAKLRAWQSKLRATNRTAHCHRDGASIFNMFTAPILSLKLHYISMFACYLLHEKCKFFSFIINASFLMWHDTWVFCVDVSLHVIIALQFVHLNIVTSYLSHSKWDIYLSLCRTARISSKKFSIIISSLPSSLPQLKWVR